MPSGFCVARPSCQNCSATLPSGSRIVRAATPGSSRRAGEWEMGGRWWPSSLWLARKRPRPRSLRTHRLNLRREDRKRPHSERLLPREKRVSSINVLSGFEPERTFLFVIAQDVYLLSRACYDRAKLVVSLFGGIHGCGSES
ncbi:protein of unknown function [Candidatus Nitrospira inopinata]|uniref:Uncharacterized protein n=1 Tax=Candidatus Nitrospira inopinata TaxID=1715989 RepID=A0A0S4KTW7_9BACT|nr:protein of unknown function [Candidatus Nitrospira inopinata]